MAAWHDLELTRIDEHDAQCGVISLPLPQYAPSHLGIAWAQTAQHAVGWWERHRVPRRTLAFVIGEHLPTALHLCETSGNVDQPVTSPWQVAARVTRKKLDFVPHRFDDIAALRGVPAEDCTIVEFALDLTYGGRTLSLQCGVTGPEGGPYWWQNVQVDHLWHTAVVEAVRVGGLMYNGDTYLWADLYLLLFANGVVDASLHFINTILHIEGSDFTGLPIVRFAGEGLHPVEATLPADGDVFDLGVCRLNVADAALLCSESHPAVLTTVSGAVHWHPLHCTASHLFSCDPPDDTRHPTDWMPGTARTVRCQFSLSDAPPAITRYRVPNWWYACCGEPWPWEYLPVDGQAGFITQSFTEGVRAEMSRGRYDTGTAGVGNFGLAGTGLLHAYYHTGRPEFFYDGLTYCYFWADLMVDHRDFSVWQWAGGSGWKTCAYSFFRDLLYGYLETGDPYLYDAMEQCAERYYGWFRANWPRCNIGRDAFEFSGWAAMARYFDSEHARERAQELLRMACAVINTHGVIGGQMGAGPHPGYLSALYMTGVCLIGMLDILEASVQDGIPADPGLLPTLKTMSDYYLRDDVGWLPCDYHWYRPAWRGHTRQAWIALALHIYPALLRLFGEHDWMLDGLRLTVQSLADEPGAWDSLNRPNDKYLPPHYFDAVLLGVKLVDDGVSLAPLGEPALWPEHQQVATPYGTLVLNRTGDMLQFSASRLFPVTISYRGLIWHTNSQGRVALCIK